MVQKTPINGLRVFFFVVVFRVCYCLFLGLGRSGRLVPDEAPESPRGRLEGPAGSNQYSSNVFRSSALVFKGFGRSGLLLDAPNKCRRHPEASGKIQIIDFHRFSLIFE